MSLSVDGDASTFFDERGGRKSKSSGYGLLSGNDSWLSFICGTLIVALLVLNIVTLRDVKGLRSETRIDLNKLKDQIQSLKPGDKRPVPNEDSRYSCLYAVGGGVVRNTGGFPQLRLKDSNTCNAVFDWYFADTGQYWKDLEGIGHDAISFLTNTTFKKGDSKNIVIFDIDETLLSNLETQQEKNYVLKDKSHHRHHESRYAPALEAIKAVYVSAYNYGMSTAMAPAINTIWDTLSKSVSKNCPENLVKVALITGRTEESRKFTEENLAIEGFGAQCKENVHGKVERTEAPCYVALHLRDLEKDMDKLASVYKPERRKMLLDAGYTLAATFGDQYSDLEGLYSAIASYKIPNPMYYIL